jgi:hypothetical protein
MSTLIFLIGFAVLVSSVLSIANITDVGLNYLLTTKIHLLPFLQGFPSAWVYAVIGFLLLLIASGLRKRK